MERIQVLIDKLVTQKAAGDTPSQLLMTVQFLQQEILSLQEAQPPAASPGISVVMPANHSVVPGVDVNEYLNREYVTLEMEEEVVEEEETLIIREELPVAEGKADTQNSSYILKKPHVEDTQSLEPPEKETRSKETPASHILPLFDLADETPTLIHQPKSVQRELHEVIGSSDASLNDRLKDDKTEWGQTLKDSPVKDLRKAIGVNDKFLFINELFRGDEPMYDRSIKTINSFQIFAEAEYWITRELKVKLGWDDKSETVKHFDQVVRRRFS